MSLVDTRPGVTVKLTVN